MTLPVAPVVRRPNCDSLKEITRIKKEEVEVKPPSDAKHTDTLELARETLAAQKDVNEAFMKELRSMIGTMGEGMKLVTSLATTVQQGGNTRNFNRGPPPHDSSRQGNTPGKVNIEVTQPSTFKKFKCYMCEDENHMMYQCPHVERYEKLGWITKAEDGRFRLKNNERLPREVPGMPRYKVIEKMAKEQGWDKADAYFVNVEEDDDEEEMERQMNPSSQVEVFASMFNDMMAKFAKMNSGEGVGESSTSQGTKN